MANINVDEIKRLAELAALALNEDEMASLESDLKDIFVMIEEINSFDTEGVVPTAQITGLKHVVRADEVKDYGVTPDELLRAAPDSDGDSIKVPSVQ